MKFVLITFSIILVVNSAFCQKKTKQLNFSTREAILGDTVIIERLPLTYIESSQKYFIDALQKQLDEAKTSIKSDSIVDEDLIKTIRTLISNIKKDDPKWKSSNYDAEVQLYEKYKIVFEDENLTSDIIKSTSTTTSSSKSRTIHTGPRGGKYYINSNGKKTYVKKKT